MNTAAVIANICIIGLEIIGLSKSISGRGLKIFAFYTQVSNIITLISSILFLVTGGQTAPVRYLSTCMLVMTFLITLCVLYILGTARREYPPAHDCYNCLRTHSAVSQRAAAV